MPTKVAVVGGGPLGLMALKNFKEDGFDVTLYESRSWIGGLWKYSDDDALSTAENTIFNSSKYRTAMSDFPIPDEMADYPPAEELLNYLESYCIHFDLWPHIKTSSPVEKVWRQDNGWVLEIRGTEPRFDTFDK
jgi:dimethylaniline monooxygenase (N-oxide forming)